TTNCKSRMVWPVKNVNIIKDFDAPAKPWLAGHRGVDLRAEEGTELYAP
ncbi:peptidase M23, partial [Gardnerella vaginalis]